MKKAILKAFCLVLVLVCFVGAFSGCEKTPETNATEKPTTTSDTTLPPSKVPDETPTTAPTTAPAPTPTKEPVKTDMILTKEELKKIYDATKGKILPIGAWAPTPDAVRDPAQIEIRYADMAAAGINFAICSDEWSSDGWTTSVLNAAKKANIGIFLHLIPNVGEKYMIDYVTRFKDHPALAGVYLKDEPTPDDFELVARLGNSIRAIVPKGVTVTANLLPNHAVTSLNEYNEYVREYMSVVKPDNLWFDHYPYSAQQSQDGISLVALAKNLDAIREEAQKNKVDSFSFIQSSSWSGFRAPTEAELRFLVNFNLMFGIRGITYYTWGGVGSITSAAVDKNGNKTDTYYAIQKVNAGIDAMKGVYMEYEQDGFIFHNSYIKKKSLLYQDRVYDSYGPLKGIVSDGEIMVGCFKKSNGAVGLYVMNYNRSEKGATKVTLNFGGDNEYLVWGTTGLEKGGKAGSVTFELAPGDGKFVTLEKGSVVK